MPHQMQQMPAPCCSMAAPPLWRTQSGSCQGCCFTAGPQPLAQMHGSCVVVEGRRTAIRSLLESGGEQAAVASAIIQQKTSWGTPRLAMQVTVILNTCWAPAHPVLCGNMCVHYAS
jgi:hypothetical protein